MFARETRMNKIFSISYILFFVAKLTYCSYGIYTPNFGINSTKDYMDDVCDKEVSKINLLDPTTEYDSTIIVRDSKHLDYPRGVSCTLTLYPPATGRYGLVVSIEYLGLRLKRYSALDCMDFVTLSDGNRKIYEGCRDSQIVFNNTGKIVLGMLTTMDIDPVKRGFDITFTVYSEDSKYCQNDQLFRCDNGQCITNEVLCDNRRNCADGSDEFMYGTSDCKTKRHRIAIVVASIFGVLFLVGIIYMVMARSRANTRRRRLISPGVIEGSTYGSNAFKTLP